LWRAIALQWWVRIVDPIGQQVGEAHAVVLAVLRAEVVFTMLSVVELRTLAVRPLVSHHTLSLVAVERTLHPCLAFHLTCGGVG